MSLLAYVLLGHLLGRYCSGWWFAWRRDRAWSRFGRQYQGAMARASLRAKTLLLVLRDRVGDGRP